MVKDRNWLVEVEVSTIDRDSSTMYINTRGDSMLYFTDADWITYPEDRLYVFSIFFSL